MERRKHARFKIKSGGLALLPSPWPSSTVVGSILDISTGGVALQYVGDDPPVEDLAELRIACSGPHQYLEKLPVKAVSDFSMAKIPFGSLVPRRLSLEFGPLSEEQAGHLEAMIKDQAIARV